MNKTDRTYLQMTLSVELSGLMERRRSLLDDPAHAFEPGVNLALEITKEFESLATQTGVSVAALEFLRNPVGLVGKGARNLTRVENVLEDVNVQLAKMQKAGLV